MKTEYCVQQTHEINSKYNTDSACISMHKKYFILNTFEDLMHRSSRVCFLSFSLST